MAAPTPPYARQRDLEREVLEGADRYAGAASEQPLGDVLFQGFAVTETSVARGALETVADALHVVQYAIRGGAAEKTVEGFLAGLHAFARMALDVDERIEDAHARSGVEPVEHAQKGVA